ncbi:hypothetical protein AURDEDRAFT_131361 [Auricularia subglabra TFB-10046 SS5]|uniref:Uncharacterized protein n=1 Tax=Auricularia subglabra (strain TFB-10046 / SS5) TaxID=717982 RepID=J0WNV7_AURST|nr:hypothetical protein AURDEDRAFT_131361 [Auricularia subglabra TFB-10046 SS5]
MCPRVPAEHVVLTCGFAACTSNPTHISYHEEHTVKARIQFVSTAFWLEEIRHAISGLVEAGGRKSRLTGPKKVAWHRITAVYPQLRFNADKVQGMTAEDILASNTSVIAKLDTTVEFEASSADFYDILGSHYYGERGSSETWPIIVQISILCNAAVLKQGITFVDLPGPSARNAARGAVASAWYKKCDHIFVVAPIQRAVSMHCVRGGVYLDTFNLGSN